jgi:hypothetical protein
MGWEEMMEVKEDGERIKEDFDLLLVIVSSLYTFVVVFTRFWGFFKIL